MMRSLCGFCIVLFLPAGISAQPRSGSTSPQPTVTGAFGSVVYPGGTSAMPGVTRSFGSVVNPGGGGPHLGVPGSITDPTFGLRLGAGHPFSGGRDFQRNSGFGNRRTGVVAVPYVYPIYVGGLGGYYDSPYIAPDAAPPAQQAQPQQPNVVVVYPQQPATPVIITLGPDGQYTTSTGQAPPSVYQPPERQPVEEPAPSLEPSYYLIAFKDHSIYSAVAYWVDGDTLHYFTTGNTHNQASISLVDRELTTRLNKDSGVEVKLPPAK